MATGGDDGRVCVWSRRSHELLLQFSDHVKPVLQLCLDVQVSSRLHSVGADRSVFTVDLKTERRVVTHQVPCGRRAGCPRPCGVRSLPSSTPTDTTNTTSTATVAAAAVAAAT